MGDSPGNSAITEAACCERLAADGDGANPVKLFALNCSSLGLLLVVLPTTNQGLLIGDNQNSLRAGVRGPSLLEDHILSEKIMHFDHERIGLALI